MPYKVNPTTGQLDYYEVAEGGGVGVATNLAFIPGPISGTITSDSGTDADIPLADSTNAGLFSAAEKTKLAGIAAGAEVNVNADWNATSGDALILNKPTSLPSSFVKHTVKYGEALVKGQAAYVSSSDGTNMIVSKADYSLESTSSKTMGLIITSGATNFQGEILTEGLLAGTGSEPLSTISANAGDPVWLGDNGNLLFGLANKPVAPNHMVFIGIVTRVHAVNGEIFVKVQNGYELDELHNVLITNLTNNQVIAYDTVTGLWKNKNLLNLTTTGYEGSATLSGNNLNIPQYKSVTYLGDFVGGDAYNAGDVVLYNNDLYYCILTIGSASAPSGDPTHWDLFLPGASAGTSEKSGSILSTTRSLPFKMATNITTYRSASAVGSTTVSSTTFAGESTHYFPISLKEGSPVRAAAFRVNSAGSAGLGTAEIELGIYNSTTNANGELIPGTLEVQFGKVSVLTTGVKEAVLASPYTLGATVDNIYWIAFRSYSTNSTSLNIYSSTDVLSSWVGMSSSTSLVKLGMFVATTPYTAPAGLPASLPATGGVGFTQSTTVAGYVSNQLLIGIR